MFSDVDFEERVRRVWPVDRPQEVLLSTQNFRVAFVGGEFIFFFPTSSSWVLFSCHVSSRERVLSLVEVKTEEVLTWMWLWWGLWDFLRAYHRFGSVLLRKLALEVVDAKKRKKRKLGPKKNTTSFMVQPSFSCRIALLVGEWLCCFCFPIFWGLFYFIFFTSFYFFSFIWAEIINVNSYCIWIFQFSVSLGSYICYEIILQDTWIESLRKSFVLFLFIISLRIIYCEKLT